MTEIVSNSVREHRQKKGVTQEDVAQAVGVSRQTIIAVERGNYIPSVLLALKLSTYFALSVEELFAYES
ncbi:MAG: helix-turn-helix transcriptional regulator [Candidatus Pacebacteria bacterium]|nr:helix-turn-helix transcriptional regulator [Candidatus Paceibacterota bacterium]